HASRACIRSPAWRWESSVHEDPERLAQVAPVVGSFGEDVLERRPVLRMALAIAVGVLDQQHMARAAEPVLVLERVRERIPIGPEMWRKLERLVEGLHELSLRGVALQVGRVVLESGRGCRAGERVRITAP